MCRDPRGQRAVCHRRACSICFVLLIPGLATSGCEHACGRAISRDHFMVRWTCLASVLAAAVTLVTGPACAQTDFPNRRIHMVVPYPAGGIVDIVARIVTDKLSEIWRQPIVVEAKPGANGSLAWEQV